MQDHLRLFFVRHGETWFNQISIVQGWCDSMLSKQGEQQADEVGRWLRKIHFSSVYSGDLGRQRRTAVRIIEKNNNLPHPVVREAETLREVFFGSFEGRPFETMMKPIFSQKGLFYAPNRASELFQHITSAEASDIIAQIDPMGLAENARDVERRLMLAVKCIMDENHTGECVLIVTSGAALSILMNHLVPDAVPLQAFHNCGVSVLDVIGNKFVPILMNDTSWIHQDAADF